MAHVYAFDHPHGQPLAEVKALIGSKAANLAVMAIELGLPVPPAFTVTTTACKAYLAERLAGGAGRRAARAHGAGSRSSWGGASAIPADPLLVSVRSGAPVSMPGMMDTILNVGLNEATAAGLAAASGDPDVRGRLPRPLPGDVPRDRRRRRRARRSLGSSCAAPSRPSSARGTAIAPAPTAQREGIPDDLGTAVTVQAMVFGNRGTDSGTGVLFTRNPATGEPALYGDVMFDAQGEDVVAGTHRDASRITVLDERMPSVARELRRYARRPRAPLRRPLRHRVHHRAGQAVDAPGPRRQAQPAGRPAHRGGDGRGPRLPADSRGGRPAGGRPPGRPAARSPRSAATRSPLTTGLGASPGRRLRARSSPRPRPP